MILFYIRHGEPIYNPDQLTPEGHKQAEALGKRLATLGITRIFSSTSNRAIQTAEPLSRLTGIEIELEDFAHESHAHKEFSAANESGSMVWVNGLERFRKNFARPDIKNDPKWYERPEFEGQNFKAGVERVNRETDAFMEKLGYKHDRENGIYIQGSPKDERVALFAHAGFGHVFMSSLLDIPYPTIANEFQMGLTGVTAVIFKEMYGFCVPSVHMYSGDGHLYKEGLPTSFDCHDIVFKKKD